jgi:hypothetical protein
MRQLNPGSELGRVKRADRRPELAVRSAIIRGFTRAPIDMEAERLNAIEATLADLRTRAGELRGYL